MVYNIYIYHNIIIKIDIMWIAECKLNHCQWMNVALGFIPAFIIHTSISTNKQRWNI